MKTARVNGAVQTLTVENLLSIKGYKSEWGKKSNPGQIKI